MSDHHRPVMFQECLDGLQIRPDGVYVDATFGGGGHSEGILNRLTTGCLLAFDQDQEAEKNAYMLADASAQAGDTCSFTFVGSNFRYLKKYLRLHGLSEVDGILADLGVSSHQFDDPGRGFSIRAEGDLDMRMDRTSSKSAKGVVKEYEEKDLVRILSGYGEVKNARTLAREIVRERMKGDIKTSGQLKEIALRNVPKVRDMKYLAQVFQAIRIEVNDELGALKDFLAQTGNVLKKEGRLVVLSYHSLEDRLVKNYINKGNFEGTDEKDFYGNPVRVFDPVNRKPIVPTEAEIKENSRAHSAKLRMGKKASRKY